VRVPRCSRKFQQRQIFPTRPSAAGTGFDATSSGGTNLGPTSQKLADSIKAAVAAYRPPTAFSSEESVPADAVTSSGSGLDPHISLANAELQAPRVARARACHLPNPRVDQPEHRRPRISGSWVNPA